MSSRHVLTGGSNSLHSEQIRAEIQRFESVHPSIYQIYDLLNCLPDNFDNLRIQLRDEVVAIEDAFVNSHEWTLSRTISEMRLGIVGTTNSGKTSLVHRYLTGTYTPEESPEGGRFKKEVVIEGQSHLLLIRDEGQALLDVQFCQWVDAVIFVFSVTCEESFDNIRRFYSEMSKCRHIHELPIILVGTKENVSEKKARIISEEEGRQMASHLKRCVYYETNSTFGSNVERVFKEACCKIIQQRIRLSLETARTPTPTHQEKKDYQDTRYMSSALYAPSGKSYVSAQPYRNPVSQRRLTSHGNHHRDSHSVANSRGASERSVSAMFGTPSGAYGGSSTLYRSGNISPTSSHKSIHSMSNGVYSRSSAALLLDSDGPSGIACSVESMTSQCGIIASSQGLSTTASGAVSASTSHLPTPSSTPNTQRKNRRISNIFQRPKDHHDDKSKQIEALNLGVGRAIPVKQGLLYKKSTKSPLNREWKKKYVCLYSDGRLTYHQNLKDYMDKMAHGKEVFLGLATVKVAGRQRPRNTQRTSTAQMPTSQGSVAEVGSGGTPTLQSYEPRRSDAGVTNSGEGTSGGGSDDATPTPTTSSSIRQIPQTVAGGSKKKRDAHRRIGSSGKHQEEDDECFEIVTHNQQRWEFCAASVEERDEWVSAIEEQIEIALTSQMTQPSSRATGNAHQVQALRQLPGNEKCADCGQLSPDWASLNLGTLICIECSGIHRNLGSHISRVRSLELDDWPVEFLAVMQAIGNDAANKMWEANVSLQDRRPTADSPRDTKETWIRLKYEAKRFLPQARVDDSIGAQLVGSVIARDVTTTSLLLARGQTEDINSTVSNKDRRTPLHLACSIGSLEIVQLLLWNNADVRSLDEQGRSCLWYAQHNGFNDCVEVLLTAGLSPDYGMPSSLTNNSVSNSIGNNLSVIHMPEGMIMGSMSNRDYSCVDDEVVIRRMNHADSLANDFNLRRTATASSNQQQQISNPSFEMLPASII